MLIIYVVDDFNFYKLKSIICMVRGFPSQVKGDRLKICSRRRSWVQIPPPALYYKRKFTVLGKFCLQNVFSLRSCKHIILYCEGLIKKKTNVNSIRIMKVIR